MLHGGARVVISGSERSKNTGATSYQRFLVPGTGYVNSLLTATAPRRVLLSPPGTAKETEAQRR